MKIKDVISETFFTKKIFNCECFELVNIAFFVSYEKPQLVTSRVNLNTITNSPLIKIKIKTLKT